MRRQSAPARRSSAIRCSAISSGCRRAVRRYRRASRHRTPTSRSTARPWRQVDCSSRAATSRCSVFKPPSVGCSMPNDDRVDGEASAVVLSYAYWESAFGGRSRRRRPHARRQRQAADDRRCRAARILGHDRRLAAAGVRADHVPLARQPERVTRITPIARVYWAYLFARLKPGVSLEQAAAAINVPYRRDPQRRRRAARDGFQRADDARVSRQDVVTLTPGARGQSRDRRNVRDAADDLAGLDGSRAADRVRERREPAARARLDACRRDRRARLARRVAAAVAGAVARSRCWLLAAGAAVVSVPLTLVALRGIQQSAAGVPQRPYSTSGSTRASCGMTVALALGSTLVFGLIPALKLMRVESNPALQSQGVRSTGGKSRGALPHDADDGADRAVDGVARARGVVRAELGQRRARRLGFRADSLTVFSIAPDRNGYTPERSAELFERLEEDLAQIPGVTAVAAAAVPLLAQQQLGQYGVTVEGYEATPGERHRRRHQLREPGLLPYASRCR